MYRCSQLFLGQKIWSLVSFRPSENYLVRDTSFLPAHISSYQLHFPLLFAVPPRFVNKVRNAYLVEGEDVQFTCTVEGAPRPQIRSVLQLTRQQILVSHFAWSEKSFRAYDPFFTLSSILTPSQCWLFMIQTFLRSSAIYSSWNLKRNTYR